MATGETSDYQAVHQAALLKSGGDKPFWTATAAAAAAVTAAAFFEETPEEAVKRQVAALKRKFHQGRHLLIKYLPRDVTEQDVRELLSELPIQSVQLQTGAGSGSARVALEEPEMLEEWDRERVFCLRGQRVPVAPAPTEMLLCVARLPAKFNEHQFNALVRSYGEVTRSFLMISERTGQSKGYGFVEYALKETALQAKSLLDGRHLEGCILCCDWLEASHVTFESLHSKCLYVDRLPPNFRDMAEFRKTFSPIVNPPYCQIALRNGCPQDWGLIEFNAADEAEQTIQAVDSVQLHGHAIRVSYYIPGVRAINLYLKLLNENSNKGKGALLPDPPAPAVFQQLQNLAKQNPVFAQNLQNIILNQIQNLPAPKTAEATTTSASSPLAAPTSALKCPSSSPVSSPSPSKSSPNAKPLQPPQPALAQPILSQQQQQQTNQAALVVYLAAQMQTQMGASSPSLLGNPQMLATLQSLIKQQGPNAAQAAAQAAVTAATQLGQAANTLKPALLPKPKAAPAEATPPPPPPLPPATINWPILPPTPTLVAVAADDGAPSPLDVWIGQSHAAAAVEAASAAALLAGGLVPAFPAEWGLPPSPPPWPPMAALRPHWPLGWAAPPIPAAVAPGVAMTPLGQKRKYSHILPSPEPSPEGNYIGQHSQGLGGHYADSFFKRKKKN
ncbi:ribonucleoprotein PTB-binding 1-like isoform X2 [Cloeon dipterum]|uniref:ribonucleoprotein PTB-binding 1-like isoform X2 n=1 Tax=Cloeon dipterum TaxID=197152 RepID=UPI00321FC705